MSDEQARQRIVILTKDDAHLKAELFLTAPGETRGIEILKSADGQLYLVRSSPDGFAQPYLICDDDGPLQCDLVTQPRFKAGDRVEHMNGTSGRVTEVRDDGMVFVTFDSGKSHWKGEYDSKWFRDYPHGLRHVNG